tara:strand:+ start:2089 stop:2421 length:333 start_codon:yes stop_codon:yes gene_type:complete
MPEYPYQCQDCEKEFTSIKRVADIDNKETCPKCGNSKTKRQIALSNPEYSSAGQPYYEPALGCIIKGKGHRSRILKERGLEEIGNTSIDTMHKDLEVQREKRVAREWDNL